jgi:HlyD family secretion protein
MKKLIRWTVILGAIGVAAWGVSGPLASYWKERSRVHYREAEATRGRIVAVVNATGTVKPVQSVSVGSFVSGPIEAIFVDFNDEVIKDQILARVDARIYRANEARDQATFATRQAEVKQVEAKLKQAKRDEERGKALQAENKDFVAVAEMDKLGFEREALEAALEVAKKSVEQAQANLDQSKANVAYTEIKSPVSGVIIDRKIDPGQTMAAQFQTPELFIVAPDMRKEMRVFASVDEADIGLIREAQEAGQPVHFTVDAYPDELFEGKVLQIRMSSTTTQNVVTYPVVVGAPNPHLKLLPGMTATISFQLRERADALRIPNAALRFYPQREQVHPDDREILENRDPSSGEIDEDTTGTPSAEEKAEKRRQRNRRHVWVNDGFFLRAVPVVIGISSSGYTEVVGGELKEGDKLVIGVQVKK